MTNQKQPSFTDRIVDRLSGGAVSRARTAEARRVDESQAHQIAINELRNENEKLRRHALAQPQVSSWKGVPRQVYGGGPYYDFNEANLLATTPTPRMCIDRKKLDVANTAWEIAPLPDENGNISDEAKKHAKLIWEWLYFRPNGNGEPFTSILSRISENLDKHDAAPIVKTYGRNGDRHLVQIHSRPGELFTRDINLFQELGVIQPTITIDQESYKNFKVGYWYNWNAQEALPYEPHEVAYMMESPRDDVPYGTSRMHTLRTILYSLMYDEEFYEQYGEQGFKNPCIIGPDVVSSTTTSGVMVGAEFETYKKSLKRQMDEYMTRAVTNSKTSIAPLTDMKAVDWLETKDDYRRLVMANFNLTPAALGFVKDIQKSTEQSQLSLYIQRGLWPRLKLIEWYMNTQVIADFFWEEEKERGIYAHGHKGHFANQPMDVVFRFKLYDPIGEQMQLDIDEKRVKAGLAKINEIRSRRGEVKLEWGDVAPMFIFNPQQWGQSYSGGGISAKDFKHITGIEPGVKEVVEAVQPLTDPQQDKKAYAESRVTFNEPTYASKKFWQRNVSQQPFYNTYKSDYAKAVES